MVERYVVFATGCLGAHLVAIFYRCCNDTILVLLTGLSLSLGQIMCGCSFSWSYICVLFLLHKLHILPLLFVNLDCFCCSRLLGKPFPSKLSLFEFLVFLFSPFSSVHNTRSTFSAETNHTISGSLPWYQISLRFPLALLCKI